MPKTRIASAATLCTLGVLCAAPAAFAADEATMAVPSADPVAIAKQHKTSVAEVLQRQARLAPIIGQLAPKANQPLVKPRLKATMVDSAKVDECFVAIGVDGP